MRRCATADEGLVNAAPTGARAHGSDPGRFDRFEAIEHNAPA
jgi:hypothetical protein